MRFENKEVIYNAFGFYIHFILSIMSLKKGDGGKFDSGIKSILH